MFNRTGGAGYVATGTVTLSRLPHKFRNVRGGVRSDRTQLARRLVLPRDGLAGLRPRLRPCTPRGENHGGGSPLALLFPRSQAGQMGLCYEGDLASAFVSDATASFPPMVGVAVVAPNRGGDEGTLVHSAVVGVGCPPERRVRTGTAPHRCAIFQSSFIPGHSIHPREARRSRSRARPSERETRVPAASAVTADHVRPRPIASAAIRREGGW
jgi:hypothetical protein